MQKTGWFQKAKDFASENKLLLTFSLILLVGILIISIIYGFVVYPLSKTTYPTTLTDRDTSTHSAEFIGDAKVEQSFNSDDEFKGLSLNVSSQNKMLDEIMVDLSLYDKNQKLLFEDSVLFEDITEQVWLSFTFDEITGTLPAGDYQAVFSFPTLSEQQPLSVFLINGAEQPGALLNGKALNSSISLDTLHSASFISVYYWIIAIAALALTILLWWMLFVKKAKHHQIFAVFAIGFGLVLMFIYTPYSGIDEPTHIFMTMYRSDVWMGAEYDTSDITECNWQIRAEDSDDGFTHGEPQMEQYAHVYKNLFSFEEEPGKRVETSHKKYGTVYQYAPAAAGVTVARLLGLGQVPTLYFGNLFNLLFYTAIMVALLRFVPFKTLFFLLGSYPYMLRVSGSFSYDVMINVFSLFFIGYILYLTFRDKPIRFKDYLPALIVGVLLAPLKIVYLPLLLLPLIIPLKNWASRRQKILVVLLTFVAGAVALLLSFGPRLFSMIDVTSMEGDYAGLYASYSFRYLLNHPGLFAFVLLRSINRVFPTMLNAPSTLHPYYMVLPFWLSLAVFILFFLSVFRVQGETDESPLVIYNCQKIWMGLLSFGIFMLVIVAAIPWTPMGHPNVEGVQGRYMIPFFPLVVLIFQGALIRPKNNNRALMMTMVLLNLYSVFHIFLAVVQ